MRALNKKGCFLHCPLLIPTPQPSCGVTVFVVWKEIRDWSAMLVAVLGWLLGGAAGQDCCETRVSVLVHCTTALCCTGEL